jgi:predicted aldo/keto reductase-like oxidoreductase
MTSWADLLRLDWEDSMEPKTGITRRSFLKYAANFALGAGIAHVAAADEAEDSSTGGRERTEEVRGRMVYRKLGRTGIMISVIAGGGMPAALYPRALELGINYWHKLGNWKPPEALISCPRESFYCDMVIDSLDEEKALQQFESGLAKSGLEMIDFFKVHSLYRGEADIEGQPGVLRAFEKLKEEGKTRWLAVSQHSNVGEVLTACIESGRFDAIQLPYNPLRAEEVEKVLALAKTHDVGVLAMKPMMGGSAGWAQEGEWKDKLNAFFADNRSIAQALVRYCLAAEGMAAAIPLIRNSEQLEEVAAAVQEPITRAEAEGLAMFASAGRATCRMCGRCEDVCPKGIALADIFRYQMYCRDYGDQEHAYHLYASLPSDRLAITCDGCRRCEAACPYGLPVASRLREAHAMLA